MINSLSELNEKVNKAVNFIVKTACEGTSSGNYIVSDDEIMAAAGFDFEDFLMYKELIADEVLRRKEILDIDFTNGEYDVMCDLSYCPSYEWSKGDETIFGTKEAFDSRKVEDVGQPPSMARMAEIGLMALSCLAYKEEKDIESVLRGGLGLELDEAKVMARAVLDREKEVVSALGKTILENDSKLREKEEKAIVGVLTYNYSNEVMEYTDKDRFLKDYKDAFESMGPNGATAKVVDENDFELRYELDKLIYNEFGEDIGSFEKWRSARKGLEPVEFGESGVSAGMTIPEPDMYFTVKDFQGNVLADDYYPDFEDAWEYCLRLREDGFDVAVGLVKHFEGEQAYDVSLVNWGECSCCSAHLKDYGDDDVNFAVLAANKAALEANCFGEPLDAILSEEITNFERNFFEGPKAEFEDLCVGKWRVHLLPPGARYGVDDCLVNDSGRTKIEFYDMSVNKDDFPEGQFVSRYYMDRLLEDEANLGRLTSKFGLCLDMDNADVWTVSAAEMCKVYQWLDSRLFDKPEKTRQPLCNAIRDAIKRCRSRCDEEGRMNNEECR